MTAPATRPRREIDVTGAALAVVVSMFWGANPVAIKIALTDAPPLALAALRFTTAGLVILLWGWGTGRLASVRIARDEWRPLVILALLFTAQIATINIGTALTSASHSAVLLNLYAVHVVVLSHFMIPGDRMTARRLVGVAIAYGGIVVLFAHRGGAGTASLAGDAIIFVSALLLGERTVYLAKAVQTFEPVTLILTQCAGGAALLCLLSLAVETTPVRWTASLGGALLFQGAVVGGFNFAVNLWLLRYYRPSALAAFFLTQPIFGVLAAGLVTGDPITLDLVLACVAVTIGIGLTSR